MTRRPALDQVYERVGPVEYTQAPRFDNRPKTRYVAHYRMNSGHWSQERELWAVDDADAKAQAEAWLPPRKATDKTWMVLWRLLADDGNTAFTPNPNP